MKRYHTCAEENVVCVCVCVCVCGGGHLEATGLVSAGSCCNTVWCSLGMMSDTHIHTHTHACVHTHTHIHTRTHRHHTNQCGVHLKPPEKRPKIFDVECPRLIRALLCVWKTHSNFGLVCVNRREGKWRDRERERALICLIRDYNSWFQITIC